MKIESPTATISHNESQFTTGKNSDVATIFFWSSRSLHTDSTTLLPFFISNGVFGASLSKEDTSSAANRTATSLPNVSNIVAHKIFVFFIACRRFISVSVWYLCDPQLKSNRATDIPASKSFDNSSTVRDFTPIVHMTFVNDEIVFDLSVCNMRERPMSSIDSVRWNIILFEYEYS